MFPRFGDSVVSWEANRGRNCGKAGQVAGFLVKACPVWMTCKGCFAYKRYGPRPIPR